MKYTQQHPLDLTGYKVLADCAAVLPNSGMDAQSLYDMYVVRAAEDAMSRPLNVAKKLRQDIRVIASSYVYGKCKIVLKPGAAEPVRLGQPGHYETPSGRVVSSPTAYRVAGGKCRYVRSTVCITVGAEWVLRRVAERSEFYRSYGSKKVKV